MTEYMVHARGEVTKVDEERHTYIITANSQEEAALLAREFDSLNDTKVL
ncbi:hypothetical protein GLP18_10775 [Streptococcus suis]|uniref:Uncharacterized protein n=1 Tax=Streptococcus suis TaxID=1307 RepID=A0A6L8N003_STRSU|nr:hypothetical protein [Streptococcus suis]